MAEAKPLESDGLFTGAASAVACLDVSLTGDGGAEGLNGANAGMTISQGRDNADGFPGSLGPT